MFIIYQQPTLNKQHLGFDEFMYCRLQLR